MFMRIGLLRILRFIKAVCSFCNYGNGAHPKKNANKNEKWNGSFGTYKQTRARALN